MEERIPRPDDPDAVDPDADRTPDGDEPDPGRERGDAEGMMRFPGEDAPEVVGAGPDAGSPGEEPEAPDAVGAPDDPS